MGARDGGDPFRRGGDWWTETGRSGPLKSTDTTTVHGARRANGFRHATTSLTTGSTTIGSAMD
ncbi:hypothetical protein AB0D62_08200 [Streptomyces massasporeus]|uniref:hypothetical protein n=1 Tax=Streptomyces massasporeus TaxID=67324 RepID=UPI00340DE916